MKQLILDVRQEAAHDHNISEEEINNMSPKHGTGRRDPSRVKKVP